MPGGAAGGGAAAMAVTPVVHGGGSGYAPKGGPSTVTFHVIVNPESVSKAPTAQITSAVFFFFDLFSFPQPSSFGFYTMRKS